jgi:hypothetical protein
VKRFNSFLRVLVAPPTKKKTEVAFPIIDACVPVATATASVAPPQRLLVRELREKLAKLFIIITNRFSNPSKKQSRQKKRRRVSWHRIS